MAINELCDRVLRMYHLLGYLGGSVEGVGGGEYGADGQDGEANGWVKKGIRGEEEDDVALADAEAMVEAGGEEGDSAAELGIGELGVCGGVDEGEFGRGQVRVGELGQDEHGCIEFRVRWDALAMLEFI